MARSAGSRGLSPELAERLRALPAVERLAAAMTGVPHRLAVEAARAAVEAARERLLAGEEAADVLDDARARAEAMTTPSVRAVLNATGVIVHTNLGRAPLPEAATERLAGVAGGYSNIEYDLGGGERRSRQAHVEDLLRTVTRAEAAIAVNNCAAAVLLACAALAGDREVVVSRGQLVEIGGSFRVPEVAEQSGARLVEVGTTNRTRLEDYEAAIGPDTGAILRAHQSNFRSVGFVEEVPVEDLCALGRRRRVAVIDDVGSGALADGIPELADEPAVRRSVAAGADAVCFSGDKLLGGPQAGLLVGRDEAIERCARHPLARAVRIDKLCLTALEATLALYRDPRSLAKRVPVLRMLTAAEPELEARAELMCDRVRTWGYTAELLRATARAGGGALPLLELEGPVCAVDPGPLPLDELIARLRRAARPVVGRARDGWLLLDPRTLDDREAELAAEAVCRALER